MRVISGVLGGRPFDSPGTFKTHPMSDKIRGALFNILGDIQGLSVLDAFAGSGALSFEAISRGAANAVAVESDKAAQRVIEENISKLGVGDDVKLIKASAGAWLQTSQDDFDLVLCDPPYNDLQANLIKRLAGRVKKNGLLVLSWPVSTPLLEVPDCTLLDDRNYGDATLAFYRKTG